MKEQKKIRGNKLTPLVVIGALLFVSFMIVYFITKNDVLQTLPKNDYLSNKIETYKDEVGQERTAVTGIKTNDKSQFYQAEIDQLTKRLGVKEKEIVAMTDIKARFVDSLKIAKVVIDEQKRKLWTWQKTYESGSKLEAKMSEKDSVLQITKLDIKIQANEIYKRRFFGADKYSLDLFSPDQNIYFDGLRVYRKEKLINPKRFGVGFQLGYGLDERLRLQPYLGLGLSYNIINF